MSEKSQQGNPGDVHPDDDAREAAALRALGALPPAEAAQLEAHVASGCDACERETRAFDGVVGALSEAIAESAAAAGPAPPPELRDKLLRRASGERKVQVWKSWAAHAKPGSVPGLQVQRAGEGEWEPTAMPGVKVRSLHVDPVRQYVTMLVRMDPGSSYPRHIHAGGEECYVLEGDLRVGDELLHAGDYQFAESGSKHGVQSTENGCLLLIVSSQDDELV